MSPLTLVIISISSYLNNPLKITTLIFFQIPPFLRFQSAGGILRQAQGKQRIAFADSISRYALSTPYARRLISPPLPLFS